MAFHWSKAKLQAVQLLAEDDLSDVQIAERVNVSRNTLLNWRKVAIFREAIDKARAEIEAQIMNTGVARRVNRIRWLEDRLMRMRKVIAERAADPIMQNTPGGTTGLLTRNLKSIGGGDNAKEVEVFEVDTGLLKEMRDHERQAAQELGQWTDKTDVTSGGKPIAVKILRGVSMDDL